MFECLLLQGCRALGLCVAIVFECLLFTHRIIVAPWEGIVSGVGVGRLEMRRRLASAM